MVIPIGWDHAIPLPPTHSQIYHDQPAADYQYKDTHCQCQFILLLDIFGDYIYIRCMNIHHFNCNILKWLALHLIELNSPNLSTNSPNLSTNSLNQHDSPSSSTTSCKIEVYEANFTVFTLKWTPQMTSDGQYVVSVLIKRTHTAMHYI